MAKNDKAPLANIPIGIKKVQVKGGKIVAVVLDNGRKLQGVVSVQYVEQAFTNQQTGQTKGGINLVLFAPDDLEIEELPELISPTLAQIRSVGIERGRK